MKYWNPDTSMLQDCPYEAIVKAEPEVDTEPKVEPKKKTKKKEV